MPNEFDYPKRLIAIALSAAFPAHSLAQTAARVDFAAGNVTATAPGGASRPLSRGAEVRVGETVSTQNGRAQMRFTDGAYISLQPQTDFKVENYVFEGRSSQNESAVMSLLKGGMRTITGLIGKTNRDGYKLQTATATVGIRGTEYSLVYNADGSITAFVSDGAVAVTNQTGTTVIPGGRSVTVGSQTSTPQTVNEKPFLPPSGSNPTSTIPIATNVVQDAQPPLKVLLTGLVQNAGIAERMNVSGGYPSAYTPYSYTYIPSSDTQTATTLANLNAAGALTSYSYTYTEGVGSAAPYSTQTTSVSSGTSTPVSAGNDGIIAWGGWFGGTAKSTTTSTYNGTTSSSSQDIDLTQSSPWFYVVGAPVPVMPTAGSAYYNMIGALAACAPGTCGTASVTNAYLEVDFGKLSGSATTSMTIDNKPEMFHGALYFTNTFAQTNPTSYQVAQGQGSRSFYTQSNSSLSGGNLSFYGEGFFAGKDASRAGMSFMVQGYSNGGNAVLTSNGGNPVNVNGVIAYALAATFGGSLYSDTTLNTGISSTIVNAGSNLDKLEFEGTYHNTYSDPYYSYRDYSNSNNYTNYESSSSPVAQVQMKGGALFSFTPGSYNSNYQIAKGTAQVEGSWATNAAGDTVLAWGRWTGGVNSDGTPANGTSTDGNNLSQNGPFHYIVGIPATSLPTWGEATYTMPAGWWTASCAGLCSSIDGASVTSSSFKVSFGGGGSTPYGSQFAVAINVTNIVNNTVNTVNFATDAINNPGSIYFTGSGARFTTNATLTPSGQSNIPQLNFNGSGFLAGPGATHAGMAYTAGYFNSGNINGVIGYTRGAVTPTPQ